MSKVHNHDYEWLKLTAVILALVVLVYLGVTL